MRGVPGDGVHAVHSVQGAWQGWSQFFGMCLRLRVRLAACLHANRMPPSWSVASYCACTNASYNMVASCLCANSKTALKLECGKLQRLCSVWCFRQQIALAELGGPSGKQRHCGVLASLAEGCAAHALVEPVESLLQVGGMTWNPVVSSYVGWPDNCRECRARGAIACRPCRSTGLKNYWLWQPTADPGWGPRGNGPGA